MMPKELRQQKALPTAANTGYDLHEAIMLRRNQLAKIQISFYRHAESIPQARGLVNMQTLKLVRNMTYFNVMHQPNQKHFNVKSGPPGLSQPGLCLVAIMYTSWDGKSDKKPIRCV